MKKVCIYHRIDLDGWMSAAIVKLWNQQNNLKLGKSDLFKDDNLDFIGYNYGDKIPDLSGYDQVIMCDCSFPVEEMEKLALRGCFVWIDHHISAIEKMDNINRIYDITGKRAVYFSACELTWFHFFEGIKIPSIVEYLGKYDSFRHLKTDEERDIIEFQYGARNSIVNFEQCYNFLFNNWNEPFIYSHHMDCLKRDGRVIYGYLCQEALNLYRNGFSMNFQSEPDDKDPNNFEPPRRNGWKKFICINKERFNPINFGINCSKDGFDGVASYYFNGKEWEFSLYSEMVDVSKIASQFIYNGVSGGGHKGAAGFKVNDITKFIETYASK